MLWPYVVGYALAIAYNQILTRSVSDSLWRGLGWRGNEVADPNFSHAWHTRAIGAIEAVVFTSSVALQRFEFIAAWLVLKAAGSWKGWEDFQEIPYKVRCLDGQIAERKTKLAGRTVFNVFLIGTALSLFGGCVGGLTIKWLSDFSYATTVIVWLALVVAALILLAFARHYENKWPPLGEDEQRAD